MISDWGQGHFNIQQPTLNVQFSREESLALGVLLA